MKIAHMILITEFPHFFNTWPCVEFLVVVGLSALSNFILRGCQ